jgi:hypothetical protein
MATREQARLALTTKIEELKATWVAYNLLVEYDNLNTVNLPTQTDPYLCVSLVHAGGWQIDLATAPRQRFVGSILLEAKVKEGQGTKLAYDLLQHFYPSLQMTDRLAPLRTHAGKFVEIPAASGWYTAAVLIPFWYDN